MIMRHIKKNTNDDTIKHFESLRDRSPIPAWDNYNSKEKQKLRKILLDEQKSKCAYCESKITNDSSHIEHIYPQSKYEERRYAYKNVVLSCGGDKTKTGHCGFKKGDYDPAEGFISPIEKKCSSYFTYGYDGTIYPNKNKNPKDYESAQTTIDKLNLNHPDLKDNRRNSIETWCNEEPKEDILRTVQDNPNILYRTAILYVLNMY